MFGATQVNLSHSESFWVPQACIKVRPGSWVSHPMLAYGYLGRWIMAMWTPQTIGWTYVCDFCYAWYLTGKSVKFLGGWQWEPLSCSLRAFFKCTFTQGQRNVRLNRPLFACFTATQATQHVSWFPDPTIVRSFLQRQFFRPRPPPRPARPTVPQPERLKATDLAMEDLADVARCCEMLRCTDRKMNIDAHRWTVLNNVWVCLSHRTRNEINRTTGHEIWRTIQPCPTSWTR